jgi:hypothetical protein
MVEPSSHERALIHDLSGTGLKLETVCKIKPTEVLIIRLPFVGNVDARVVWRDENFYGCEFIEPISDGAVSAAILRSRPYPSEDRDGLKVDEVPVGINPSLEDIAAWASAFDSEKGLAGRQLLGFRKSPDGLIIAMVARTH